MTGISHATQLTLKLLAQGYTNAEVAAIQECSPQAVSELARTYGQELAEMRAEVAIAKKSLDVDLDELEGLMIERMGKLIPFSSNLTEVSRAFQVVNAAKRRADAATTAIGLGGPGQQVVNITLPTYVQNLIRVEKDSTNRVVAVDGRSMATANQKQIMAELAGHKLAPSLDHQLSADLLREAQNVRKEEESLLAGFGPSN